MFRGNIVTLCAVLTHTTCLVQCGPSVVYTDMHDNSSAEYQAQCYCVKCFVMVLSREKQMQKHSKFSHWMQLY